MLLLSGTQTLPVPQPVTGQLLMGPSAPPGLVVNMPAPATDLLIAQRGSNLRQCSICLSTERYRRTSMPDRDGGEGWTKGSDFQSDMR